MRVGKMFSQYPSFSKITLNMRPRLYALFQSLTDGISEFTFANLYLFRKTYQYEISEIDEKTVVIRGKDRKGEFFMFPFDIPKSKILRDMLKYSLCVKALSGKKGKLLEEQGFTVQEDRDNFDYLYLKKDLEKL